jgi:hypothetical protein
MKAKFNELREVNLSNGTKEYIAAYKTVNEAVDIVCKELVRFWGVDHKETITDELYRTSGELQAEILRLMGLAIESNLREEDNCNEI